MKPDNNIKNQESLITYDVEPKDNLNAKGEGQITHYSIQQRKKNDFFVVENFEFGSVDYCCTLRMILADYSEAVNSLASKRILAMRK